MPAARTRYLAEISDTVRGYKKRAREQARLAREIQQLQEAARMLTVDKPERAPAELARAVIELLSDPARLARMRAAAVQRAHDLFDVRSYADNVTRFYLKVLGRAS